VLKQGHLDRRGRQTCDAGTHRTNQLIQSGVRKMRPGLHTGRTQNSPAACARERGRFSEPAGLPDSWLAPQDRRPAAIFDVIEQRREELDFRVPTNQRRSLRATLVSAQPLPPRSPSTE